MLSLFILNETFTNGFTYNILNVISLVSIICGISVIISKNPIVSVLFLIGLFLSIAAYLMMLGINFIGLAYLLVYVGAVSILFLFILMLINVRISELLTDNTNSIPLAIIINIIFSFTLYKLFPTNVKFNSHIYNLNVMDHFNELELHSKIGEYNNIGHGFNNLFFNNNNELSFVTSQIWDGLLAETSHITAIGNIIYTAYPLWLIITSIILLLAMVGSIVITTNSNKDYSILGYLSWSGKPHASASLPLLSCVSYVMPSLFLFFTIDINIDNTGIVIEYLFNFKGLSNAFASFADIFSSINIHRSDYGLTSHINNFCSFNYGNQIRAVEHYISMLNNYSFFLKDNVLDVYHNMQYRDQEWHSKQRLLSIQRDLYYFIPLSVYLLNIIRMTSPMQFIHALSSNVTGVLRFILLQRAVVFVSAFNMFIVRTLGNTTGHNLIPQALMSSLGCVGYVLLNWFYDFRYHRFVTTNNLSNSGLNLNYMMHRLVLGAIFYLLILLGVLWSTSLWQITNHNGNIFLGVGMALAYSISYLANVAWLFLGGTSMQSHNWPNPAGEYLSAHQGIVSLLRSLTESTAFGSLSWATFALWEFWIRLGAHDIYAFPSGLFVYIFSGFIQINLEESYNHVWLYGFIYNLSFTSLAFSTNGLFSYINDSIEGRTRIALTVLSGILVWIMPMEFYRIPTETDLYPGEGEWIQQIRHRFPRMAYLYLLFLSFASHTYWLIELMSFMR